MICNNENLAHYQSEEIRIAPTLKSKINEQISMERRVFYSGHQGREDAQDSELSLYFGRIEKSINCFRGLLTFSGMKFYNAKIVMTVMTVSMTSLLAHTVQLYNAPNGDFCP